MDVWYKTKVRFRYAPIAQSVEQLPFKEKVPSSILGGRTKTPVFILLHNIRSVHNVGSMFRTSDALGISKIYLTGHTPTPVDRFGNKRKDVAKVALGAEESVPWEYQEDPVLLVQELKKKGIKILAVEQDERAVDYKTVKVQEPTLFIFGNEVNGVTEELLSLSDTIAAIPMSGKKESLNVSVSFGIALFGMLNR